MYVPQHFEEPRIDVLHDLIRRFPLATLVNQSSSGLNANHIPFLLSDELPPFGRLRGHVAAANPMLGDLPDTLESLAIFHGPSAYITPSWYATKQITGKVVPTWNYAVVHAYGHLRIIDDRDWLRRQIEELTDHNEAASPGPWSVSDAPKDSIDKMISGIIGIEMVITKMVGKWKVSQNQPAENQASVIEGLKNNLCPGSQAMATLVESRAKEKPEA
ncbi:MAG TPA: transcriptional regulator [Planctomycetaceae bacterium]|nr:transcriptional regulator [Planctomycetaceae bacterium]